MLPPTLQAITALGASLKAGRYRSASVYLSACKSWTARRGHDWTTSLQQSFQDAVRSCERGVGGPVKARALPFSRLGELPGGDAPWAAGGPVRPRNAIIIGSWFLTREIELSSASAAALELTFPQPGVPQVRFHLPASKTDVSAAGTAREHGCSCRGSPVPSCPAHAAWDHLTFLRERFPDRWQAASPPFELPLFPTELGTVCAKDAMAATIIHAAILLGVELASPDGSERVSGHSLRATGAQGLAAAGVDTWAIELLGRWGSDAVRGYVRDVRAWQMPRRWRVGSRRQFLWRRWSGEFWPNKAAPHRMRGAHHRRCQHQSRGRLTLARVHRVRWRLRRPRRRTPRPWGRVCHTSTCLPRLPPRSLWRAQALHWPRPTAPSS